MEFKLVEKEDVWKRRGRPARPIPPKVAEMADRTYRSTKVAVVSVAADEHEEARELIFMLRAYAKTRGRHMRIQYRKGDDVLKFEMCDLPQTKAA